MVKVILSDFQYLTRAGFSSLLKEMPEFILVEEVRSDRLIRTIESSRPDLLAIDFSENEQTYPDLQRIQDELKTNILVFTNDHSRERIQVLLTMGVKAIVTKNCSKEEIISALKAAAVGNRFFCPTILDVVVDQRKEKSLAPELSELTPREVEVVRLVAKGFTTNLIADKLHVSVHTINSHRKNILRKLNLSSPTELIIYALEKGWSEASG